MILNDLFESRMSELDIEYQDYKNLEPVAFLSRYKMSKDQWANKHWSLIKGDQTMHEGAVKDLHAELEEKYRELAPSIEKYKDSFLAGQLYDALEAIAMEHGAELEFKRMMNGARNRAHMDYDTNPGGFQNWFWYLPFADNITEGWKTGAALGGAAGGVVGGVPGAMIGAGIGAGLQHGWTKRDKELKQQEYELADAEAKKGIPTNHFIEIVKQLQAKNLTPAEIGYTIWGPDAAGSPSGLHKNFSLLDYIIVNELSAKGGDWEELGRRIIALADQGTTRLVKSVDKWGNEIKEQSEAEESQDDRNARIIAGEIEDAMSQGKQKLAQQKIKELISVGYTLDKDGQLQRMGMYEESELQEKQDACYHKVKSRYKVWPSAYASGALVQCRKKGAANWGTGGKKK
jgi:hypothetical protein